MKKLIILSLGAALATTVATAQSNPSRDAGTVSKKGISILPEAKDFAIGVDANPFLNFIGNAFNGNGFNSAPSFEGFNGGLYGKYFLTDKSAIRAKFNLRLANEETSYTVADDYRRTINPLDVNATTVDYINDKISTFDLRLGYEMRRGYGRLQGFYGGEVMIGASKYKTEYSYGNEMTALNQSPTTFMGNNSSRELSNTSATLFRIGVGGFAGVEYYISPKIAIGGELGLNFFTETPTKYGESKTEYFNNSTMSANTYTDRNARLNYGSTSLQTITTGNIFVMFHF
jgi:hypothetical protein